VLLVAATVLAAPAGVLHAGGIESVGEHGALDAGLRGDTCTPAPLAPADGALLANGRRDGAGSIAWTFQWTECPGASEYRLVVRHLGAEFALVDASAIPTPAFSYVSGGSYIDEGSRLGWVWTVQALVDGTWSGPSAEQRFDVAPPD